MLSRYQFDTSISNFFNVVCYHRGFPRLDGAEQIIIRDQTQPLVPRVVAGRKMLLDINQLSNLFPHLLEQGSFHHPRRYAGQLIHPLLPHRVTPTHNVIGKLGWQIAPQPVGETIHRRTRDHVSGRPLQHRHVRGLTRHIGDQRHRRCTRPNHHDLLVLVSQSVWPELGMYPIAAKIRLALKFGFVALLVAVIAGAHHQKSAPVAPDALRSFHRQLPLGALTAPVSRHQLLTKTNMVANAIFIRGFVDIAQNGRSVCNRLFSLPRLKVIAQGMHVAV